MTLQSSGPISLSQIQAEFGGSNPISLSEYYRGGGLVGSHNTNVPTSGSISLSNFYGASKNPPVTPGSVSFTTPGTYNLTIPLYNTFTADVRGGSGGGCGCRLASDADGNTFNIAVSASAGSASSFAGGVFGNGGGGGISTENQAGTAVNGAAGTASGGDSNITGGGPAGGSRGIGVNGGGDGGPAGRAVKTYSPGQLTVGANVTIVVGPGGAPGSGDASTGGNGAAGAVFVSWS